MDKGLGKIILPALILCSFIFLLIYIFRLEHFTFAFIQNPYLLIPSIFFLCGGMIFQALCWFKMLQKVYPQITLGSVIASSGLTIFAKYIPGKIFAVISRGEYISQDYSLDRANINNISFQTQIITLLFGLAISFISYMSELRLSILITIVFLIFLILVFPFFLRVSNYVIIRLFKKNIQFSRFSIGEIVKVSPYFLINWICWCIGFYFLILSCDIQIDIRAAFTFALAAVGGILAIFSPGGIGVRETILVLALQEYGLDFNAATSVSVLSRVWFLIGEIFLFVVGSIYSQKQKRK